MPHKTTGYSPFKMLYGREALKQNEVGNTISQQWEDYNTAVTEHTQMLYEVHNNAWKHSEKTRTQRKTAWD